jgi:hypothetical protein
MLGKKWLAVATAAGSLSAGVAVAASGSGGTAPITADFQANLVAQQQRPCDATRTEFHLRFAGSETSSDPRLTGDLEATARSILDTQTGHGTTTGSIVIRDAATHRPTFRGTFVGVLEPGGGTEGFLIGRTLTRPSVQLLANMNLQQDQTTFAVTGELGKHPETGADQDPAVLTAGCGSER